ncbi:Histone-lysine N-methyltransferase ATX2 [Linum perenne]
MALIEEPSESKVLNKPIVEDDDINLDNHTDAPVRYVSLDRVYTAASLCVSSGGSNVMSKKVKARRLVSDDDDPCSNRPPIINVYSRKCKKSKKQSVGEVSRNDLVKVKEEIEEIEDLVEDNVERKAKKRRIGSSELVKLGVDSSLLQGFDLPRLRDCRNHQVNGSNKVRKRKKKSGSVQDSDKVSSLPADARRWARLSIDGVDPKTFIGLQCKASVYWPLDVDWYSGRIVGYNSETNRHQIHYEDGDTEDLLLSKEKAKFYISREEMEQLNLSYSTRSTNGGSQEYEEMVVLAASLDDCQDLEPGDLIWAKLTGHAVWPAIVVEESVIGSRKGLKKNLEARLTPVQFFGTHDFARIKPNQVISFLKGLLSSFHLKCKQPRFTRSLEEAKMYLSEQKLPTRMVQLRKSMNTESREHANSDDGSTDSGEDCLGDEEIQRILRSLHTSPYVIGDLQIISLGKIVKDSEYFQDDKSIWPEGYTALRKYTSAADPGASAIYKMQVLRDSESKIRPLFRVTFDNGDQIEGSTPSLCWNKIYGRIKKLEDASADLNSEYQVERTCQSGSHMFGFSNPEVIKLIKGLSKSRVTSGMSTIKSQSDRYQDLPAGYRPVRVDWKDLDKCNVCHMDEEYENNLFLQCDKCRMMVHARCYGELEPVDGVLWLCNLCRPGAPEFPPPCCLCPVIGGAMKPTTDGRWAHLACAIWIPETCLLDVKRMEPIDGLNRINKDRWKLLCSICGVAYGACIQCSNHNCCAAYHPLCARAAGLCVELEDEERLYLLSMEEDDEEQCIRLLSFCKRHKQPSNDRPIVDERISRVSRRCSDYVPPCNLSGCARTEPYNHSGRRGRKEPEVLAAASSKRAFVENQPYLVGGYCRKESSGVSLSSSGVASTRFTSSLRRLKSSNLSVPSNILSMAEKYDYMKQTFRKRLAFGKSAIHGFGIFTKHPHRAGDMMIEYTGELVRPSIADRREGLIYNSLVGAGTYMFRIDNERVIDATRAGSIAHLINHSCEPNCYSRVISVNGDEHIIIYAKRDIKRWEELTYDYRFFSIDEQLPCYCGFPRCRGVVNDVEAEEQLSKHYAPSIELIDWTGE